MNNEEAIEILESIVMSHMKIEAIELAIQALEKQIPRKPIEKKLAYRAAGIRYSCPADCNSRHGLMMIENYCLKCGQAIDWRK